MKIIIEGDFKKVNQLHKELIPRVKRDKLDMEVEKETIKKEIDKAKPKAKAK